MPNINTNTNAANKTQNNTFNTLDKIVKKTVVGLALIGGLSSCATYGGMMIPSNESHLCPPDYNYDKNCKVRENEYNCQPRCVYSPTLKPNTRYFGGANESSGALEKR